MKLKNEKVFVTGGAGFLGRNVIKRIYDNNEITVYSRDEAKHYYLGKLYPNIRFVVLRYVNAPQCIGSIPYFGSSKLTIPNTPFLISPKNVVPAYDGLSINF